MRVSVYVDGFNLYYRALRRTPYKWLNPALLARNLLDEGDSVGSIRFFTARISPRSGDLEAPKRQNVYLSALRTVPGLTIHYGRFLPKTKVRPLVSDPTRYVEVHDTEEKGSDVSLASHLLIDGIKDRYGAALVLSQDTDLLEPLRMVRTELGKALGLVWLDGRQPGHKWQEAASFVRHLTGARLAAAQFPPVLMGQNGRLIHKPPTW